MIINHNLNAMNAHRQLGFNTVNAGKSMEKLSSGLRINRAGDDAAGLAISEKMRGQIRGLNQASRNSQDAISLIQTAEGALNETHAILQRMRELSVQAANDTNTGDDRTAIQKEINELKKEVDRIATTTEFNTKKLLNGQANRTSAVSANITGTSVSNSIEIVATATSGKVTGTGEVNQGSTIFQNGTGMKITGDKAYGTGNDSGPNVTASDNELTFTYDGTQYTIALAENDYSTGADNGISEFIANLQSKIDTAIGGLGGDIVVSRNTDGKIEFKAADITKTFTIDGGNALTHLTSTGTTADFTTTNAVAANNTLTVKLNGIEKTVNLTNVVAGGTYDFTNVNNRNSFITALQDDLDNVFGTGNISVEFSADNKNLVFTSTATGSISSVEITGGAGSILTDLGLDTKVAEQGKDVNNVVSMTIDGEAVSATIAAGTYDANVLAAKLQEEINNDTTVDATVKFENGNFTITSGKEGASGSVAVSDNAFAKTIGLSTAAVTTAGRNAENRALNFQIGSNNNQIMDIDINDMGATALGISDIDVTTYNGAQTAIEKLDTAIKSVSEERAKLGAYQNRLEHTIANLGTSSENLTAAESRIRDVDMAKEMMIFSKNNILAQAAQAMLAQANQQPQGVLQLLR